MRMKRILAVLLVVCLIAPTVPVFVVPVEAATSGGSNDTDISEMNALEAIGINTSELPEGVDLNSLDNPYGRDTVTINPVYELFVQGNNYLVAGESKLYGHNKALGKPWSDFYKESDDVVNLTTSTFVDVVGGGYSKYEKAATASASGDFMNSEDGKKGQVVTVATNKLDKNGGIYLYFGDPVNDTKSATMTLLGEDKIIGNSDNQMYENFSEDPYLMQNYLKVATGDYDGDGLDEVAVYVPEQGCSRVEFYDLQIDDTYSSDNAATYFEDISHWKKSWTYYFNENPYVSNMVSLASGDFNQDGIDDIAMTWGYYYGSDAYTNSKAMILCGSKDAALQKSMEIELEYEDSLIVRGAFALGDIDGDNVDDLILGGQLNDDIKNRNLYSRFVGVYTYDGNEDKFIQSISKNFDLFKTEKNDAGEEVYLYPVMAEHNKTFYSSPNMVANVASMNMLGVGQAANIYLDSLVLEYGSTGLDIKAALDQNRDFNEDCTYNYPDWYRSQDGRFYSEYNALTADFTGDTHESLQVMLYYSKEYAKTTETIQHSYYKNWWDKLWGKKSYYDTSVNKTFDLSDKTVMVGVEGILTKKKDNDTGEVTYEFSMNTKRNNVSFATSYCKLNSDNDTSFVSYTGKHMVTYSDPKVLSIIASPPYFKDLDNGDLSGKYMGSSTSYGSSEGTGTSDKFSFTMSIGAYVKWKKDFKDPITGTKLGSIETEAGYKHGFTWNSNSRSMVNMSVNYTTIAGQDSVAFYSIPMEQYIYNSYVPILDENGNVTGYDEQEMSVNIPHTAAVATLSLDKYERIAADYDELPQIQGTALKHTIGDPASYPSSSAGYEDAIEYNGEWLGVDFSAVGTKNTQKIKVSERTTKGWTHSDEITFKIGGGPGSWVFGVQGGVKFKYGSVDVSSSSDTFSGTICNMPIEAESLGYYYAWKLFAYQYNIGDSKVPVISYLVKDVTAPPKLPVDFAQDNALTTDEEIGLSWSYPSDVAISGFQIYRYYEFPEGDGSYELAFIPASDVRYITEEDGKTVRHYQYIDEGLADYTEYEYQIQTVRAAVPNASILSEVLAARTKADKGYPTITLNGVETEEVIIKDDVSGDIIGTRNEYSVLVYPDTNSTVAVSIEETYDESPRYQWQKLTDEGWADIIGAINMSYTFKNSGASDEGTYRCRVNAIYEDEDTGQIYYISAFSDQFDLEYQMRTPVVVEDSFIADVEDKQVSIALKSGHVNHAFLPTGNITFNISGVTHDGQKYESSVPIQLVEDTIGDKTIATLDLGNEDKNQDGVLADLPEGVYEINAYYGGSRVFSSLTIPEKVYYVAGDGEGYIQTVASEFIYGEEVAPDLKLIKKVDGEIEYANEFTSLEYKLYREEIKSETVVKKIMLYDLAWGEFYRYFNIPNSVVGEYYENHEYTEYEEYNDYEYSSGSLKIMSTGNYQIVTYVDGKEVASDYITINPKAVTIGLKHNFEDVAGSDSVEHPSIDDLEVVSDELLIGNYGDTISNIGLQVNAFNTAGTEVTIDKETNPGKYILEGAASESQTEEQIDRYKNYDITYVTTTYILTGPRYDLSLLSQPFGNDSDIVGTVSVINPESLESATTTCTDNDTSYTDAFIGGTAILFAATPQVGYQVKSWTVNGQVMEQFNGKEILSYQTTADNVEISVEFELAKNTLRFFSDNGGAVVPIDSSIASGAMVQEFATYEFEAIPNQGYHFVEWRFEGATNDNYLGDYDEASGTSASEITMGDVDTRLSALFLRDSYTLELQPGIKAEYEEIDGFGNTIEQLKTGTVTIIGDTKVTLSPETGYSLQEGIGWYVNDVLVTPENGEYTFVLTSDTHVSIGTVQNIYDVAVNIIEPSAAGSNQIEVRVNESKADFSETRQVSGGAELVFVAKPEWGYVFDYWKVNGVVSEESSEMFTIDTLGENTVIEGVFKANSDSHTVSISKNDGGHLTYSVIYNQDGDDGNAPIGVESADNSNVYISVYDGDSIVIDAVPDDDFMLRSWTVGDNVDEMPQNKLTISDISEDINISARFIAKSFANVSYEAGNNGRILSATSNGEAFNSGVTIGNGTEVIIEAQPDEGYMIDEWVIDGVVVNNENGCTFIGETLIIDSLAGGDATKISVSFRLKDEHTVTYNLTNVSVEKDYSPEDYTGKTHGSNQGDVIVDYVLEGTQFAMNAKPDDGYRMTEFTVNGVAGVIKEDGTCEYICDEITDNIDITIVAKKLYDISLDDHIENGSIAIETSKDEGQAIAGEIITLTSVQPVLDYRFIEWTYNDKIATDETFLMPAEDVIVSAKFLPTDTADISYGVSDANGVDEGGYNGTVSVSTSRALADGLTFEDYPEATTGSDLTVHCGYKDKYTTWADTIVSVKASPDSDYRVKYWYLNGEKVTSNTENCNIIGNTLKLTVGMDALDSYDIQVQYDLIGDKITYSASEHCNITQAIITSEFGDEFTINSGDLVSIDGMARVTVEVDEGYEIDGWFVNGVRQDGENGTTYSHTVHADKGMDIQVFAKRSSYEVSFEGTHGDVVAAVEGNNINSSPQNIVGDSIVAFTATPDAGYAFDKWIIDGENSDETSATLSVVIVEDIEVEAYFIEDENCTINYEVGGVGGTLIAKKDGTDFNSGDMAAANDVIRFTATPDTINNGGNNNFRVQSWKVGETTTVTADTTYELTVEESLDVSVVFERYDYVVTYGTASSGNGQITTSADSSNSGNCRVFVDDSVTFTATPNNGYQVKSWTINGSEVVTEEESYTIENLSKDTSVVVTFEEIPTYTITVVKSGTGYGSVSAQVEGEDEVLEVTTIKVSRHSKVELKARGFDVGNAFAGWSIPAEIAVIKDGSLLTLTDVTEDITVDAKFTPARMVDLSASETDENGSLDLSNVTVGYTSLEETKLVDLSLSSVQVTVGMDVVIMALPDEGYMVKEWLVNGKVQEGISNTFKLEGISENSDISVTFEPVKTYDIPDNGIVDNDEYYIVTPTHKTPDNIGDERSIRERGDVTFTVAPLEGYYLSQLVINGVDCIAQTGSPEGVTEDVISVETLEDGSYSVKVSHVTKDVEYTVLSVKPIISITSPEHGELAVSYKDINGLDIPVNDGDSVPVGTTITLKATPDWDYELSHWSGAVSGKYGYELSYVIPREDVEISVAFREEEKSSGGDSSLTIIPSVIIDGSTPLAGPIVVTIIDGQLVITGTINGNTDNQKDESQVTFTKEIMEDIQKAVDEFKKSHEEDDLESMPMIINMDVAGTGETRELNMGYDKEALSQLPEGALLYVETEIGSVTLESETVKQLIANLKSDILEVNIDAVDEKDVTEEMANLIGERPVINVTIMDGEQAITDLGEHTIGVSLPYVLEENEVPEAVIVQRIGEDSELNLVTGGYNEETGLIDIYTNQVGQFIISYNLVSFDDVSKEDWYYNAITYLAARGVVIGTSSDSFDPDENLTRAQFVVMLMRAFEIELLDNVDDNFEDAGNSYYTDYLASAKEMGIANGIGENLFAPEDYMTRQEMVMFLYNMLVVLDRLPEGMEQNDLDNFIDVADIADWAKEAMIVMVNAGIIKGNDDYLDPKKFTTRGEAAQVIFNLLMD